MRVTSSTSASSLEGGREGGRGKERRRGREGGRKRGWGGRERYIERVVLFYMNVRS